MNDDELTALATDLRVLRERWGESAARAALADNATLSLDQRARVEALVFFGSGNQFADVTIDDVVGGDVVKGIVNVSGQVRLYGPTVGVNLGTVIYGRDPSEDERRQIVGYLQTLAAKLYRLPLRGIDERLDRGEGLSMPRVYVALTTTAKRLAVAAVAARDRLILLGEPDSGKSTFLRHLAWVLAQCMLDPAQGQVLLPAWDLTQSRMPIILPLRALAERLEQDTVADRAITAALLDVIGEHGVVRGDDLLVEALCSGAALLLFDGLDEVPLAAIPGTTVDRMALVVALHRFCRAYPKVRAVITCRTRAFGKEYGRMLGWPEETLARFTRTQMRAFAEAWYEELTTQGLIDRAQAQQLATTLLDVVKTSTKLNAMAGTPLLLTMMALVLYNKGELPHDRPQLYEQVLELLLGQWDKVRQGPSMSDAIGLLDCRQPVRDHQRRAVGHQRLELVLDLAFKLGVERGRRLVQNQNGRVAQQRTCDRDALTLPP